MRTIMNKTIGNLPANVLHAPRNKQFELRTTDTMYPGEADIYIDDHLIAYLRNGSGAVSDWTTIEIEKYDGDTDRYIIVPGWGAIQGTLPVYTLYHTTGCVFVRLD